MLRAMGFRTGLIRTAMLSEAGLIAVQGTVIGAVLGLITTRQMLTGTDSFGDESGAVRRAVGRAARDPRPAPRRSRWQRPPGPASRAAHIRPAVALRAAD